MSLKTVANEGENGSLPEGFYQNQSLPKAVIIRHKRVFETLFSSGARIKGSIGQLIFQRSNTFGVGFIVGRRTGNAVVRNTLRRRMREFYRTNKTCVPEGYQVLFHLFPSEDIPTYKMIVSDFSRLCQKL